LLGPQCCVNGLQAFQTIVEEMVDGLIEAITGGSGLIRAVTRGSGVDMGGSRALVQLPPPFRSVRGCLACREVLRLSLSGLECPGCCGLSVLVCLPAREHLEHF
jgi:hypothetical protein